MDISLLSNFLTMKPEDRKFMDNLKVFIAPFVGGLAGGFFRLDAVIAALRGEGPFPENVRPVTSFLSGILATPGATSWMSLVSRVQPDGEARLVSLYNHFRNNVKMDTDVTSLEELRKALVLLLNRARVYEGIDQPMAIIKCPKCAYTHMPVREE